MKYFMMANNTDEKLVTFYFGVATYK